MNVPLWVGEAAAEFWEAAGGPEPFPRWLRGPIARAPFDLTVKELPGLSVRGLECYLRAQGVAWRCAGPNRPLRACLAAYAGAGFILLDAGDPRCERTFSLAHELAHFLRHYRRPRRRAVAAAGAAALEVLDGRRPPRPGERLYALLRGVPLGCHVHLMAREAVAFRPDVAGAEREADRLACELLAPAEKVAALLGKGAGAAGAEALLRDAFGLPAAAAGSYSGLLFPAGPGPHPLLARLEKSLAARRTSGGGAGMERGGSSDASRP